MSKEQRSWSHFNYAKRIIFSQYFPNQVHSVSHTMFYYLDLDDNDPIKLYPGVERVEKEEGGDFSIICTTERMKYYSSKFYWFKENGILPKTANIVRHQNFIRLDFSNLKIEETGLYKCNITDDTNLQEKRFQLIVFGK